MSVTKTAGRFLRTHCVYEDVEERWWLLHIRNISVAIGRGRFTVRPGQGCACVGNSVGHRDPCLLLAPFFSLLYATVTSAVVVYMFGEVAAGATRRHANNNDVLPRPLDVCLGTSTVQRWVDLVCKCHVDATRGRRKRPGLQPQDTVTKI